MMWKKPSIISGGFGRNFPKAGHVTIFDRSWYGRYWWKGSRVFVPKRTGSGFIVRSMRWRRIFIILEPRLLSFGYISIRMNNYGVFRHARRIPKNSGSLHEEDWRNREKWKPYEEAVEEMFLRTHTKVCPVDNYRR